MTEPGTDPVVAELFADLARRPPRLSPRWFYDEAGSRLFERITRTPEYYPTRTELGILRERGREVGRRMPAGSVVVELGSGSGDKAIALLSHLDAPRAYRPIDISPLALEATCRAVRDARPDVAVFPFEGDFFDARAFDGLVGGAARLVYYSGSTIGNLDPPDAAAFLQDIRARLVPGDALLLAVDLVKDPAVLDAAYNDAEGVTAAFNRNALQHINAVTGADFVPEAFDHHAFYDVKKRRIEMHLVSTRDQTASVLGRRFHFPRGSAIHTESSYKFEPDDLPGLARAAGFTLEVLVTDEPRWFAEALMRA